jgi:hypothetical protein
MLQPFDRLFPEGAGDDDRTVEEEMSDFKVVIQSNIKIYQPKEGAPLKVWNFGECVAKLREARKTDPWLAAAGEKIAIFHDKHKEGVGDKMHQLWAADCERVWNKAHDYVMSEAPPPVQETPKKVSIFKRNK